MSPARVFRLLRKDMAVGPRSPFFLFVLVWPIVLTALIQLVFGELFSPTPRLGIVDEGDSQIAEAAEEYAGIDVTRVDSREDLWVMVEENDVDIGWALAPDFDAGLARGDKPLMDVKVGGQSMASHRVLLAIAIADVLRSATPHTPVKVAVVGVGEGSPLSLETRLMPMMVLFSVMIAGIFLTASSIVDEKVKGTLAAILVTPMSMSELLLGKGILGFVLAMICGLVIFLINGMFSGAVLPLLVVLALAALMMAEFGLILGTSVKNTNTLFTVWKGGAWLLCLPIIPYLWDAFPVWAARLSPTYCFVDPAWRITIEDASLADVAPTLGIGVAICVVLMPVIMWIGRRALGSLSG